MPKLNRNRIFLTGFMGAGKSTIGPILASRLQFSFKDSDQEVQRLSGMSVTEIFSREGEKKFREWESRAVENLIQESNCVVALGGGSILDSKNRERIFSSGTVIYLKTSPRALSERLALSDRPLLKEGKGTLLERITKRLFEREPYYSKAHLQFETDKNSPEEIVEFIMMVLKS